MDVRRRGWSQKYLDLYYGCLDDTDGHTNIQKLRFKNI